jgi:hypothetical protein
MGKDSTDAAAQDLNEGVRNGFPPGERPADGLDERNGGVEMSATHRPQQADEHSETRDGRSRVGEQC